ncbi:MAG: hypothetical protein KA149_12990 [Chitinophagales bacterium]|nr:hypothetical protein [Chitinophagales bacterium]
MKKNKTKTDKPEKEVYETVDPAKAVHGTTTEPDKADIEEFKERKEESKKAGEEEAKTKEDKQA